MDVPDGRRSNNLTRWGSVALLIGVVAFGVPNAVDRFGDGATFVDWLLTAVLVLAVVGAASIVVQQWRRSPTLPSVVVTDHDIIDAIDGSTDRVSAVRALRERYPHLSLSDATRLVDAQRHT